ncbi:MAG: hypothetical protein IKE91_01940 [Clostridia bacterium]|nr:hypothetical protein [Clostridia bacterium]
MKKIILVGIFSILLCFTLFISSNKSVAYTYTENNVTYTRSDPKENSVSKTLKKEKNNTKIIIIAIIGGVLVSSIVCGILASRHKPVKVARAANSYLDSDRVNITRRDDFYMRSSVDKMAK